MLKSFSFCKITEINGIHNFISLIITFAGSTLQMNVLPKINRLCNFQGYYKRCVSTCCEHIILPKWGFVSFFLLWVKKMKWNAEMWNITWLWCESPDVIFFFCLHHFFILILSVTWVLSSICSQYSLLKTFVFD